MIPFILGFFLGGTIVFIFAIRRVHRDKQRLNLIQDELRREIK